MLLAVATRWLTVGTGMLFGLFHDPDQRFLVAGTALVAWAALQTIHEIQPTKEPLRVQILVVVELVLTVSAATFTGGLQSPFVLTPITGLLLAGYVWGRRATLGTAIAGVIGAAAAITIQRADPVDQRSAQLIAVVFLLCGALGAFTRNLVADMELHRAQAIDQAAQMVTANDLLMSLHSLAQTLPASFDLGEVVDSIRLRLRSLLEFTTLVVLVRDNAESAWNVELAEGVRLASRLDDDELPPSVIRVLDATKPIVVTDHLAQVGQTGFAALAHSGLYVPLRTRGALVGIVALEDTPTGAYGPEQAALLSNISSVLALSIDNARWFRRLRILGAEAERARIARELHDRIAQSLAYVTFELERLQQLEGEKHDELGSLHTVVRDIVRDLRETIYQLRANVSENTDLVSVADDYLPRFQARTGIAVVWSASANTQLPYRVEQELWRILQEALTNVERHAAASQVAVSWSLTDGVAQLEITDDGRGFDPGGVVGDHYGLVGMRERADAIGARLAIQSRADAGTRIVIEVDTAVRDKRTRRSA